MVLLRRCFFFTILCLWGQIALVTAAGTCVPYEIPETVLCEGGVHPMDPYCQAENATIPLACEAYIPRGSSVYIPEGYDLYHLEGWAYGNMTLLNLLNSNGVIVDYDCLSTSVPLLCASFFMPCFNNTPVPPCRSLCDSTNQACSIYGEGTLHNGTQPALFDIGFTKYNCDSEMYAVPEPYCNNWAEVNYTVPGKTQMGGACMSYDGIYNGNVPLTCAAHQGLPDDPTAPVPADPACSPLSDGTMLPIVGICASVINYPIYVPEAYTTPETLQQYTYYLESLAYNTLQPIQRFTKEGLFVDETCYHSMMDLVCATTFMRCAPSAYSPLFPLAENVTPGYPFPQLPCRSLCETAVSGCGKFDVGQGNVESYNLWATTTAPDCENAMSASVGTYQYFPDNQSYPVMPDLLYVQCNSYENTPPPQYDNITLTEECPYPLGRSPDNGACAPLCPTRLLELRVYDTTNFIVAFFASLSCLVSSILIITWIKFPEKHKWPVRMVLPMSVAAWGLSLGFILQTYPGYQNVWCETEVETATQTNILTGFCGVCVMFFALACHFWWLAIVGNLFLNICFEMNNVKTVKFEPYFRLVSWGIPAILSIVGLGMGRIGYADGNPNVLVSGISERGVLIAETPETSWAVEHLSDCLYFLWSGVMSGIGMLLVAAIVYKKAQTTRRSGRNDTRDWPWRVIGFALLNLYINSFVFLYKTYIELVWDDLEESIGNYISCQIAGKNDCVLEKSPNEYVYYLNAVNLGFPGFGIGIFFLTSEDTYGLWLDRTAGGRWLKKRIAYYFPPKMGDDIELTMTNNPVNSRPTSTSSNLSSS